MKKRFLKTYVFQKYSNSSFGHFFNYKIVHNKVLHSASIPPVDSPKGSRFEMTLKTKFKIFRYDLENFTINPQLFYPSEHKLMNIRLPCVIPKGSSLIFPSSFLIKMIVLLQMEHFVTKYKRCDTTIPVFQNQLMNPK